VLIARVWFFVICRGALSGFIQVRVSRNIAFLREPRGGIVVDRSGGLSLLSEDEAKIFEALCLGDEDTVKRLYKENRGAVASFLVEAGRKGYIEIKPSIPILKRKTRAGNCVFLNHFIPIVMVVEATRSCNARCPYCYLDVQGDEKVYLDIDKLDRFLDKLTMLETGNGETIRIRLISVNLTGGEPLLHPSFLRLLSVAAKYFRKVVLSTNGILLGKHLERIVGLRDKVVVRVAIDSLNPDIYARAKGVDGKVLYEVLGYIEELLLNGVRVVVVIPVSKINIKEVGKTVSDIRKRFGDRVEISIAPTLAVGQANPRYVFGPRDIGVLRGELRDYDFRLEEGVDADRETMEYLARLGNCGAGWKLVSISADGYVKPCPIFPEDVILGSIDDEPGKVLGSKIAHVLSRATRPGSEVCRGCKFYDWCRGCIARALALAREGTPCPWAQRHLGGVI